LTLKLGEQLFILPLFQTSVYEQLFILIRPYIQGFAPCIFSDIERYQGVKKRAKKVVNKSWFAACVTITDVLVSKDGYNADKQNIFHPLPAFSFEFLLEFGDDDGQNEPASHLE